MMRAFIVFIAILMAPMFVFAEVPPPQTIPIAPHEVMYQQNNFGAKFENGKMVSANPNASGFKKSHFNSASNSGGNIVGGRPINATVNNGYGNTGTIKTQAASTYSKTAALRGAANKSIGVVGTAYAVWQLSDWSGTQVWNLYDCVVYDSCHPNAKPPPVPPNAPAPPQIAWEAPQGAYDPNAKSVTVFFDSSNKPMIALYGVNLGSGGGTVKPGQIWITSGVDVSNFGYAIPEDQYGNIKRVEFNTFTSAADLAKYQDISYDKMRPEDFVRPLTEQDLYNALIWNLEHMPQEIATAIMNALHDGGFLGAPESTVFDPASYTSPAYTASDTGLAQQDKFTINQDGSISHQVIARPDLQGNQQLAPEKQPSTNTTNPTDPTTPTDPTEPEPPLDMDVPDVAIPVDELNLNLNLGGFSMPAYCPQPRTFEAMGSTYSISYQPFCDFASLLKGLIIMMATVSAYFIVSKGAD